jgi:hypothetical protein
MEINRPQQSGSYPEGDDDVKAVDITTTQLRTFIYGVGVGITLSFAVVFALSSNLGVSPETADSTIVVGQ